MMEVPKLTTFLEKTVFNTEGIKYMGSKLKLLPYIFEVINSLNVKTILDGFSGTTRVSQMLYDKGSTNRTGCASLY